METKATRLNFEISLLGVESEVSHVHNTDKYYYGITFDEPIKDNESIQIFKYSSVIENLTDFREHHHLSNKQLLEWLKENYK